MLQRLLLVSVLVLACAAFAKAATQPNPAHPRPLHPQVYHGSVILAKPKASQRATVDRAEVTEQLRVRQKFARLADLRVIEVDAGESTAHAIARLQATGRYDFVEPDYIMRPDATPDDPGFTTQWALNNTGVQPGSVTGADIHAPAAWDQLHDAPDVIVAVIDGGVRVDHADLAPNLWTNPSPTFGDVHGARIINGVKDADLTDEDGHGTHVAGIICAAGNNGVATAGVVWKTRLMVLKNAGADGFSYASDSAACIDYAIAHGANVINCSWGSEAYSGTLYTAFSAARDAGIIMVCSAGNDSMDNDYRPHYPSNFLLDNVISVGNSTPADEPSPTSDYGNLVDLFAPGTSILSLDYQTTTGTVSHTGTSMAAPFVTGTVALLRELRPGDTYRDTINRVLRSVDRKQAFGGYAATNGRLNLQRALTVTNTAFNVTASNPAIITGSPVAIRTSNQWTGTPTATAVTDPIHVGSGANPLWWLWVAPADGTYVIDTGGSACDTGLDVYGGTLPAAGAPASSTLTPLASNDDDGTNRTSRVTISATSGQYIFICVTGQRGSYGYTQLNIAAKAPNDDFANATVLSGESDQGTVDNHIAGVEPGEPALAGGKGAASIWYRWTAPRDGQFQVSSFTYNFDTVIGIYTGSSVDQLTLVTSGDDTDAGPGIANSDSRCTLNAKSGTTYYIQVESKTGRGYVTTTITDSAWQFSNDGGQFTASPALASDGTVYIGATHPDHRLYAVSSDGTLKWSYLMDGSMDMASPAVGADGTIYQGTDNGIVAALKPDGTLRWSRDLGTGNYIWGGIAVAADGTLYLHAGDGYLYALNPSDGSTKWKYDVGAFTYGSAVIASDGTIYQGSDGNKTMYALNPDGTLKWRYELGASTYNTPAIDGSGNLYFATFSNSTVMSMTPAGVLRWTYVATTKADSISGSPSLSADGKTLYIGVADGKLHAVDCTTGTVKWTYACGDAIYGSTPAVDANGVVYVGAYNGDIYAITATGTLKRKWDTGELVRSSPVISGTRLYVGSGDAKLYAFEIGAKLANGPWPEFRHDAQRLGRVPELLAVKTAPQSQAVLLGGPLTLSTVATGQGPLSYQWAKNGTAITGATTSTYTIASAKLSDSGTYTVTVTGPQGSTTSTGAVVNVTTDLGRLTNVSIRSQAGTGSQTLIVGLTIRGGAGAKKPVLIRGIGPTLKYFSVPTAIPDPMITVYQDHTPVLSNDGWADNADVSAVGGTVGAFPLPPGSLDAALYTQLPENGYTIHLTGKTGAGTALVEVYDATAANSYTTSTPRIINVSARTQVGTGGDVLIAGFGISGTASERVLIRGVGPKLVDFNVDGVLADPKLEIFSKDASSKDIKIAENDDWGGSSELVAVSNAAGAFPLDPKSKDAVLLLTLPPGSYSAIVSGVGDTTGVAMVEVYEAP